MTTPGVDTEPGRGGAVGPGERRRRAVRRTPPALVGVAFGATAALLLASPWDDRGSRSGALRLVVCCGFSIGYGRWLRREDRQAMGPSSALDREIAERVLRTGAFPESRARDEQVRRLLERRRPQEERESPAAVATVLVLAAAVLVAGVLSGHVVQIAGAAIALVAVPALLVWWSRRTRARYDRIAVTLDERARA